MANAPWRCSECGTINEPVANACRTCGRWPSLFDLEKSTFDSDELEQVDRGEAQTVRTEVEEPPTFEASTFETETFEPEAAAESFEPQLDPEAEPEPEPEGTRRRRRLVSFLVPLAFVIYLAISIIFGDRQ